VDADMSFETSSRRSFRYAAPANRRSARCGSGSGRQWLWKVRSAASRAARPEAADMYGHIIPRGSPVYGLRGELPFEGGSGAPSNVASVDRARANAGARAAWARAAAARARAVESPTTIAAVGDRCWEGMRECADASRVWSSAA